MPPCARPPPSPQRPRSPALWPPLAPPPTPCASRARSLGHAPPPPPPLPPQPHSPPRPLRPNRHAPNRHIDRFLHAARRLRCQRRLRRTPRRFRRFRCLLCRRLRRSLRLLRRCPATRLGLRLSHHRATHRSSSAARDASSSRSPAVALGGTPYREGRRDGRRVALGPTEERGARLGRRAHRRSGGLDLFGV